MIEFIKNNQWIFWIVTAIGTLIASYFLVKNWLIRLSETNKKIFDDTLKSKYLDLFEFSKSDNFSQLQLVTKDFNPAEILGFCYRVRDFKDKGNRFKGLIPNCRFNRMYNVAKQIDSNSNKPHFSLSTIFEPDDTYLDFFYENENNFNKLKRLYKKFYLSIFDNL